MEGQRAEAAAKVTLRFLTLGVDSSKLPVVQGPTVTTN